MKLPKHAWGFFSGLTFILNIGLAGPCWADEGARLADALRRAQQASTAAQTLCPSQAAARTQIQNTVNEIQTSINTYTQRLQDNLINDVQADYQTLSPLFSQLGPKVDAIQQASSAMQGNLNLLIQAVQGGGLQPNQYPNAAQLLDQARAVHDALEDAMEKNDPLLSFTPRPSYAQWMAIANYKQNPDWYQQRNQKHVDLQDELDTVMRQAYQIYGNRTSGAQISGAMYQQISQQFRALGSALGPVMTKASTARQATDQILVAMQGYPNTIRNHRTQLANEAETKAAAAEQALQTAKAACTRLAKADMAAIYGEVQTTKPTVGTISKDSPYARLLANKATSDTKR